MVTWPVANLTCARALHRRRATAAFSIEFLFARHLFCRFGCAVGLFQSLSWMGNDRAMVVGFDRDRADRCHGCNNACDNVCPMRSSRARSSARCSPAPSVRNASPACTTVQGGDPSQASLLRWVAGADALPTVGLRTQPGCPDSKGAATDCRAIDPGRGG